jgi:hypothetical protein
MIDRIQPKVGETRQSMSFIDSYVCPITRVASGALPEAGQRSAQQSCQGCKGGFSRMATRNQYYLS